jgi:uncharacterized membrane protein
MVGFASLNPPYDCPHLGAMDTYLLVKMLHIIGATIVFGTGIGIANFMFLGYFCPDPAARAFAARITVRADFLFTLPAVIVQPLSGAWLICHGGFAWNDYWLALTYALYMLAGVCWLAVVAIQMRMKAMLEAQAQGAAFDEAACRRLFRWWFMLGWPGFGGLFVVFWLMVAKPTW